MTATPRYLDEIEGSEVPHVPPGAYLARLEGVERATTRFGEALKWHWTLEGPEGPFELTQMTSTATTGGSNAGRIIKTLRGRALGPGEKLGRSEFAGRQAVLDVSVNPESGWNRVEDIHPAPAKPGSAQAMIDRLAADKEPFFSDDIPAEPADVA